MSFFPEKSGLWKVSSLLSIYYLCTTVVQAQLAYRRNQLFAVIAIKCTKGRTTPMSLKQLNVVSTLALSTVAGVVLATAPADAAGMKGSLSGGFVADATPNSIDFYTINPSFTLFPIPGAADDSRGDVGDFLNFTGTGDFSSLIGKIATIKDLTTIPLAPKTTIPRWLDFDNDDFDFTLTSFARTASTQYTFEGFFKKGGTIGRGVLTTPIEAFGPQAYALSIIADGKQIPTPALLPGLLGMAAAVLRKGKSEVPDETTKEA